MLETRADIKFVALANAQVASASRVFAPAIFNNAFGGFSTGANIVNPNANPTSVTITYYDSTGRAYAAIPVSLPAHGVAPVYQGGNSAGLPTNFYGSATISSSAGNIVVVVNEAGNTTASGAAQSGTYAAAANGSSSLGLPEVANGGNGFVSGATILNTSEVAVSGTISYYNPDGTALVGHSQSFTIAAHASQPVYQGGVGLPNGFAGQAIVTQSSGTAGSLIVTTNVQNDSLFYTYTESGSSN